MFKIKRVSIPYSTLLTLSTDFILRFRILCCPFGIKRYLKSNSIVNLKRFSFILKTSFVKLWTKYKRNMHANKTVEIKI